MPRTVSHFFLAIFTLLVGLAGAGRALAEEKQPSAIGKKIENFELQDSVGKKFSLADFKESKLVVVAFLGTECPLVNQYSARLAELQAKYKDQGVAFLAINANQQDSLSEIAHHVKEHKIEFPVLKDPRNAVADQFAAQRTPEVFVLDEVLLDGARTVRYHGRIDDQYIYERQKPKVEQKYLIDALDALLAGKEVTTAETEAIGCHIGRLLKADETSKVTYSNQISRILNKNCVQCHRAGEIAPFALTDYNEVVGWAEMIAEVVQEQRMPPWHANPEHGTFKNDRRLTADERKLIYDWVEAGAPQGDPKDLPPPPEFVEGWRIGEPDAVVKIDDRPYKVPARGEVKYQYFVVDPGWTEDKYIQAAEARAGNRAVVHHIIVAHTGRREARGRAHGIHSEWITAMAPGSLPLKLEEGYAKLVPAGSKIVFQMHYTPNGTATQDLSYVGFKFADPKSIKHVVGTNRAATRDFVIPAGEEDHRVDAQFRFDRDSKILAMFPHMHLRGKAFRYTAVYPDGRKEILLDIPRYDFNWQNGYAPVEPLLIPAGTRLMCEAHFDNSTKNLANPNPKTDVRWGDQTWEEMMIGYFDMCYVEAEKPASVDHPRTQKFIDSARGKKIEINDELKDLAAKAFDSQDAMLAFGAKLRETMPQLDRACLTSIHGGKMKVEHVAQEVAASRLVGGLHLEVDADGMAMAKYAAGDKTEMNADLSVHREGDMRFMARRFASSLHVPVKYQGNPATINFWSQEPDAFPPEAIPVLEEIAKMLSAEVVE